MPRCCLWWLLSAGLAVSWTGQVLAFPIATAAQQFATHRDNVIIVGTKCKGNANYEGYVSPCCGDHPPDYCK